MVVAEHEIAVALGKRHHRIQHIGCHHARVEVAKALLAALEPGRQEGQRERVPRRDVNRIARQRRLAPQGGAGVQQQVRGLPGGLAEGRAGPCQRQRVGVAVHQFGAHPVLQRADAARQRRLRDVPQLGGTRETACAFQHKQVFNPFQLHDATP
ncbi:hypothetical protein D3C81_1169700 [compost metagenome]